MLAAAYCRDNTVVISTWIFNIYSPCPDPPELIAFFGGVKFYYLHTDLLAQMPIIYFITLPKIAEGNIVNFGYFSLSDLPIQGISDL